MLQISDVQASYLIGYRKCCESKFDTGCLFVVLKSNANLNNFDMSFRVRQLLAAQLTADELAAIKEIYFIYSVPLIGAKADRDALSHKAFELLKLQC